MIEAEYILLKAAKCKYHDCLQESACDSAVLKDNTILNRMPMHTSDVV